MHYIKYLNQTWSFPTERIDEMHELERQLKSYGVKYVYVFCE